jgi:hypothetical protein
VIQPGDGRYPRAHAGSEHDVIETAGLDKRDAAKLSERVHEIVAAPVNAHIAHMDAARGSGKPAPVTHETNL